MNTDQQQAAARARRNNVVPGRPNSDPPMTYEEQVARRANWPGLPGLTGERPAVGRRADNVVTAKHNF